MEIIKNIEIFTKAKNVIHSCITYQQLDSAQNYCKLYYNMFDDRLNYERLIREVSIRRDEITFT